VNVVEAKTRALEARSRGERDEAADAISDRLQAVLADEWWRRDVAALSEIARWGEALALCDRARDGGLLSWASDVIGDCSAPQGASRDFTRQAHACLVFLLALGKLLDPERVQGTIASVRDGEWRYCDDAWGEVILEGGRASGRFSSRVSCIGDSVRVVP
jgi:hypothetical protein